MSKIWTVEHRSGGALVAFDGELDLANASELEADVAGELVQGALVVLDLRGLRFLDSSGLRAVLRLQTRAAERAARVVLVRGPAPVQRLLDLAAPQASFEFVDDPGVVG